VFIFIQKGAVKNLRGRLGEGMTKVAKRLGGKRRDGGCKGVENTVKTDPVPRSGSFEKVKGKERVI